MYTRLNWFFHSGIHEGSFSFSHGKSLVLREYLWGEELFNSHKYVTVCLSLLFPVLCSQFVFTWELDEEIHYLQSGTLIFLPIICNPATNLWKLTLNFLPTPPLFSLLFSLWVYTCMCMLVLIHLCPWMWKPEIYFQFSLSSPIYFLRQVLLQNLELTQIVFLANIC